MSTARRCWPCVLSEEQYQRLRAEQSSQEKMRKLYELVPSWDTRRKDQLYRALRRTNRHLVEELEGGHFVDQNRTQLIQRVTEVDRLFLCLRYFVLNQEQYQSISTGRTNVEKMQKLYELAPSWRREHKDELYRALRLTNSTLVEELEGEHFVERHRKQLIQRASSVDTVLERLRGLGPFLDLSVMSMCPRQFSGGEESIKQHSTTEQGRKDKCNLCPTEKDPQEKICLETVCGTDGKQETYRVHLPKAGMFCCSETDLGFEVRGPVTIQYGYDSWDQHLAARSTPKWVVAGPLFSIRAEPAWAVRALHLPHFLCLTSTKSRGEADASRIQIAHFTDGGMTLVEPTGVRPFHAVLANPSFSLYGVLLVVSRVLPIPVHALVLIYQALRAADTTLHLYLIPNDRSLEKAIKEHEERNTSFFVDKAPQTKQPLYFGTEYAVSCLPEAEITPQILTFSYISQEKRQPFIEVYIKEMKRSVQLSVGDRDSAPPCWEATLRPGDVQRGASSAEHCTGTSTGKTTRDLLVSILDDLEEAELKNFKSKLTDIDLKKGYDHIPKGKLENAKSLEVTELLISYYKMDYALEVTMIVLEAINQKGLAKRLRSAMRADQE